MALNTAVTKPEAVLVLMCQNLKQEEESKQLSLNGDEYRDRQADMQLSIYPVNFARITTVKTEH